MNSISARRGASEVVLVVVGILLAFWLDAGWERHNLREQELTYLAAMRPEFEASAVELGRLKEKAEQNVDWLELLRGALLGERAPIPADSLTTAVATLWYYQAYYRAMPAFDEFLGTVGLGGITDPALRRALVEYESALELNEQWDTYVLESTINSWEPTLSTRIPSPALGLAVPDIGRLADDLQFLNLVAERMGTESGLAGYRLQLSDAADEVVRRIDADLGR